MTQLDATGASRAGYELPLPEEASLPAAAPRVPEGPLSEPMLVRSAQWFCRLRWFVIAVLLAFGLLARSGTLLQRLGFLPVGFWPLAAAGVLAAQNVVFLLHVRSLSARARRSARANLWAQILLDLAVLSAVVYFCGGPRTYVPFTYLFHIVLACVFFTRVESLLVLLAAGALFAVSVAAVHLGVLPPQRLLAEPTAAAAVSWRVAWMGYAATLAVWTVVWYLVAGLSTIIRRRDLELADTNRRLLAAQVERSRHMLSTTHQLKAPFAAIQASAQLILNGYTGQVNPETLEVVERIAARSRRLANEIHEMLQLANLNSTGQDPPPAALLDLAEVLGACVAQVEPIATQRRIEIRCELRPAALWCVEDHLKMLLGNLLSNAVNYSRPDGLVSVRCGSDERGPWALVADRGIGIAPDKLPRIFDEYYRTNEALAHFRESSGLGLAIVREVAGLHGIGVHVESAVGEGTTFTLRFRPPGPDPRADNDIERKEEVHHGIHPDR